MDSTCSSRIRVPKDVHTLISGVMPVCAMLHGTGALQVGLWLRALKIRRLSGLDESDPTASLKAEFSAAGCRLQRESKPYRDLT